jgi:hypothetical protein
MNDFFGLRLEDFLPAYPDFKIGDGARMGFKNPKESIFKPYGEETPETVFTHKREFYSLPLDESKPDGPGIPLMAQHNVARFISPRTLNDELLLFHGLGSGKCVHPTTRIYLGDDTTDIESVWRNNPLAISYEKGGEWKTLSRKIFTRCISPCGDITTRRITRLYRQLVDEILYTVILQNGSEICCTGIHKLYTGKGNWKPANQISIGDVVYREKSGKIQATTVDFITERRYVGYVYDLEVEEVHNYFANGIVTHNTCSAVTIAELARSTNPFLKKTLVLVKGGSIKRNFINELAMKCTKGTFIPDNYENLTRGERVLRMNRLVNQYYEIHTFETFAKNIVYKSSDAFLRREYSDRVILIDEAHNIRPQPVRKAGEFDLYTSIHRFLHVIENRKIALLTGTPMRDKPSECASIMNLILPLDKQLVGGNEFMSRYFTESGATNEFRKIIRGRVSYLRSMESNVLRKFEGATIGDMKHIRVYGSGMSEFQNSAYLRAVREDTGDRKINIGELENIDGEDESKTQGLYDKSRQAALFVFPDGSYGMAGFQKYMKPVGQTGHIIGDELRNILTDNRKATPSQIVENIRKYSCVYAETISQILAHPEENTFVYNKYVEGSGGLLFAELLSLVGFSRSRGHREESETDSRKPRYAIITGTTASDTETDRIIDLYNDADNRYGKHIQVIIGSQVIGEGRSLKNVRQEHIQTPHWNNSETEQAIARGVRAFSQEDLEPSERYSKIFRHASLPKGGIFNISYVMYKISEDKDIQIKRVERAMKEESFDCELNRKRNQLATDRDGSRECDYMQCEYKCSNYTGELDPIDDTYNLYYADEMIGKIETIVKQMFRRQFSYDLTELVLSFGGTHPLVVIRALKRMIDRSVPVINRYGFRCYLREDKNLYFLVDEITAPSQFCLGYYAEHPNIKKNTDFTELIRALQIRYSTDKIDIIRRFATLNEREKSNIVKIIDNLPFYLKREFIEGAILKTEMGFVENSELRRRIIDYYQPYIKRLPDKIVHTYTDDESGKYRCMIKEDGKYLWKDCGDDVEREIEAVENEKKQDLRGNNPYRVYGIIDAKQQFKIMEVKPEDDVQGGDKRKKLRGAVCTAIVPKEKIVNTIGRINSIDGKVEIPAAKPIDKTRQQMIDYISGNENLHFTATELRAMNKAQLESIYYWSTSGDKKTMCNLIQNWFTQRGYIMYEN